MFPLLCWRNLTLVCLLLWTNPRGTSYDNFHPHSNSLNFNLYQTFIKMLCCSLKTNVYIYMALSDSLSNLTSWEVCCCFKCMLQVKAIRMSSFLGIYKSHMAQWWRDHFIPAGSVMSFAECHIKAVPQGIYSPGLLNRSGPCVMGALLEDRWMVGAACQSPVMFEVRSVRCSVLSLAVSRKMNLISM